MLFLSQYVYLFIYSLSMEIKHPDHHDHRRLARLLEANLFFFRTTRRSHSLVC